jgi:hypothetical protein
MFSKISLIIILLFQIHLIGNSSSDKLRKVSNNSFKVGEKLTFDVKLGFVVVGIANFHIPTIKRISGRDAYHVNFEVNTVPSFDPFFKVRDRYETYIDVEGIFPWRFEQHIREGNFSRDYSAFFDQRKGRAKTSEGSYEIPKFVHDIVSAFYYARTLDYSNFKKGDKIKLQNFYRNKVHDLDVLYLGKETVTVPAGKFNCIIVEPLVQEGGLFKHEGNILIWLTDDALKIPVRVKTKVIVGYIDADLTAYEGLAGQLKAKIK